ncbi:unnamed protein product [Gulo gulo]|uniref:Uncharacterized protein n=1 Tax=Gulo gulo TaxID=48420 RepID=A0A9X9M6J5_GULGU|nr:unnamed protein product [Gulo gulo]
MQLSLITVELQPVKKSLLGFQVPLGCQPQAAAAKSREPLI